MRRHPPVRGYLQHVAEAVMRGGELAADIPRKEANEEVVMARAAGLYASVELAP